MAHQFDLPIINTLLPGASEDDVWQAKKQVVELTKHIEIIDVRGWVLSFAQVWERDLVGWGLEKFSMGFSENFARLDSLFADLWIKGEKFHFSREHRQLHDEKFKPMRGSDASRWYEFIKHEMDAFPTLSNADARWSALTSSEWFTVQQWRDRVLHILHILPPEQRARYEQVEISQATPRSGSSRGPGRL
jgi:hypothetical protein